LQTIETFVYIQMTIFENIPGQESTS